MKPSAALRRQHVIAVTLAMTALATVVMAHLASGERQVGFACDRQTCWRVAVPQTPESATFIAGAVDLTGDGNAEIVQREGEELRVLQDGVEIWRSEPGWRIVDVALGDPNDDGRYEILAALWKLDAAGKLRSHPYIIAHRGGRVKLIWGGSAVTLPIHELALADSDGDGVQELWVVESAQPGDGADARQRTLSVWDWHGWGFNLRWRSKPGHYHDLGVTDDGLPVVTNENVSREW